MKTGNKAVQEKLSFINFSARDYILFAILGFVAAIVPLIVKLEYVPLAPEELEYIRTGIQFTGSDTRMVADFFSYYKSIALSISIVALIIFYGVRTYLDFGTVKIRDIFKNPIFLASLAYVLLAALSTVASPYKNVSVQGISSRYEGLFILIGYMLLLLATMDFARSRFQVRLVFYALCFSATVIGLISMTQLFKHDFFLSNLGGKLVMGDYYGMGVSQSAVFTMVYATLFNPNCVGLYTALIMPMTISVGIFYKRKSPFKYFLFILSAVLFAAMLGSSNVGGFVATAFTVVLAVVIGTIVAWRQYPEKLRIYGAVTSVAVIVLVALMLFVPYLNEKAMYAIEKAFQHREGEAVGFFTDLKIDGDDATIFYRTGQLTISVAEGGQFTITDSAGNKLEPLSVMVPEDTPNGKIAMFNAPDLGEFRVNMLENAFSFDRSGFRLLFAKLPEGGLTVLNSKFKTVDLSQPIPSVGFKGNELFASSRGYIWSRSIPLLKNSILIGSGPDTFPFEFPQDDIIGKIRNFNDPYIIVDKPHNFYLQTAINTGILSLVALSFIFAVYIFQSLKAIVCYNDEDPMLFALKLGIFLGVCGYLVAAIATDSVVSVAPVFWIVLGLGFTINKYSKENNVKLRIVK